MSDLSWLNPTPHAIAVYASRPLSPVAAQHSLPSGRYPLLGPDFHRLDRTSLRLAHSFNHLVGHRRDTGGHFEAERLRGLENARGAEANLTKCIHDARAVAHQAAGIGEFAAEIGGGNAVTLGQCCEPI